MRFTLLCLALVLLVGCAGNLPPIDADQVQYGICLATCKNGTCEKVGSVWQCVPPDPCAGKTPLCERNDDTGCWAQTPDGKCTWFPKQVEPEPVCPATCPVGQVCTDPAKGCELIDCRVTTCPAGSHCEAGKGCVPDVVVPPPAGNCPAGEPDLVSAEVQPPLQLQGLVQRNIAAMGDTTGNPPRQTLDALAARIRAESKRCVISGVEAIFVERDDHLWEEYHAVYFGNGGLIPSGKPMGVHRLASSGPVVEACPATPCPERVWRAETLPPGWGDDAIGKPRWSWKAKEHTMGNADSTPVVDRNCGYCNAVMNDPNRCSCPVRPDGHPERVAVENWLLQGSAVRDSRNGQDCTPNNTDNPFAFLFGTGNCRICNAPKTVCSAWM